MRPTTARLQLVLCATIPALVFPSVDPAASAQDSRMSLSSGPETLLTSRDHGEGHYLLAKAMLMSDTLDTIVREGVGFNGIEVGKPGCNKEFIKPIMGGPVEETEQWLNYKPQRGIDFFISYNTNLVSEIRLNPGFQGRLSSPRFHFFPKDQSGDTVYILIERSSIRSVEREPAHGGYQ